jgi:hypothetical protein
MSIFWTFAGRLSQAAYTWSEVAADGADEFSACASYEETMKLLPTILLYASFLGATTTTVTPPKPTAPATATNLTPLQQVQKYADGRKITLTKRGKAWWLEIDNVDAFGIGATKEAAIEYFLVHADLLDHELNKPHLTTIPQDPGPSAGFVCPTDQNCL